MAMGAKNRTRLAQRIFLTAFLWATPSLASAQHDYPSRTIKIIVPLAAGGVADIVPRIVADKLATRWGQPVIIENRPGAGHNIGAEVVAKAEPDGYTLLATPQAPLVISQFLSAKLPFDPGAFTPVTILTSGQIVLIVNAKLPVSSLREFVAYAKANPGKISYASPGSGSSPHLTAEMLNAAAGIQTTHVPYKGLAPAVADLLAGHVDMMFDNLGNSLQHIKAGRLKALGIASETLAPELPEVPAISATYPGFLSTSWFGMVAPPKTPAVIAAKISQAVAETLRLPDVHKRLRDMTITPVGSSPAETAAWIEKEAARWREVIVAAGIKSE
jgi:tripartite-type tricarboxylate transporter receptor subunit TctC